VWSPHNPEHPVIVWSHSKLDGSVEVIDNICTLHLVWSAPRPGDVVRGDYSTSSVYGTWRGTRYEGYTDSAAATAIATATGAATAAAGGAAAAAAAATAAAAGNHKRRRSTCKYDCTLTD
jgi:hypothetical protein